MRTVSVTCEALEPECIMFRRGSVCRKLEGYHAWLYRQMIWQYGKAEATERFWGHWNKENGVTTPDNAVQSL